jgi:hypothetical protein
MRRLGDRVLDDFFRLPAAGEEREEGQKQREP